ncbi:hypothetical protein [Hymenobacter sp. B81]|uniref:Nmad2 family putative nucleotide modification protein n=1 Tax=Hymenobacter sp. B81 TaxID=3344878 RepID=UPI0037DC0444
MSRVYLYVVDRDLGFAPNPYHGICSLATCKPTIRNTAQVGDWVVGIGGGRLNATGRCVYAMQVTAKVTFNQYWTNPAYQDKKPVRNGSKKMMLGDNIYFRDQTEQWHQAPSHHSNVDGSINTDNRDRDTQSAYVLLSTRFYYFGSAAVDIPDGLLQELGYKNGRGHRVYSLEDASRLIAWIEGHAEAYNKVVADPFNFDKSAAHYSVKTNRMT